MGSFGLGGIEQIWASIYETHEAYHLTRRDRAASASRCASYSVESYPLRSEKGTSRSSNGSHACRSTAYEAPLRRTRRCAECDQRPLASGRYRSRLWSIHREVFLGRMEFQGV